jgi:PAS domain-containing protein
MKFSPDSPEGVPPSVGKWAPLGGRLGAGRHGEPHIISVEETPLTWREAALWRDAAFLRSVLAASRDCITVLDLDGNPVFVSEGCRRPLATSSASASDGST